MASISVTPDPTADPSGTPPANTEHTRDGKTERVVVDPNKPAGEQKPAADPNRPAWLPEKFKTPEDMAKAYNDLEKKQGAGDPPKTPDTDAATKAVTDAGLDMAALSAEFAKDGKLSDTTYESLKAKGISREVVDTYVAGQKALMADYNAKLASAVGGEKVFNNLLEWAGTNLSEAEIVEANKALGSMNPALAKLTLDGISARYKAAMGTDPALVDGEAAGRISGVKPFASNAELIAAMNDPRYEKDEAYRQSVYKRLDVTNMNVR